MEIAAAPASLCHFIWKEVPIQIGICAGENISVRRFARFNLGEGLQKKEEDFAEEIAKASAAQ
jgi:translation elongation factor EF-Ts